MIITLRTKGVNLPVITCDACGQPIDAKEREGIAAWNWGGRGGSDECAVRFLHKGPPCDDRTMPLWAELHHFFDDLLHNASVEPQSSRFSESPIDTLPPLSGNSVTP